jgi:hypothetical protein
MSKARARERAKAKAGAKSKKRKAAAEGSEAAKRPGQFDPGTSSINSPGPKAGGANFGGHRRASARSR